MRKASEMMQEVEHMILPLEKPGKKDFFSTKNPVTVALATAAFKAEMAQHISKTIIRKGENFVLESIGYSRTGSPYGTLRDMIIGLRPLAIPPPPEGMASRWSSTYSIHGLVPLLNLSLRSLSQEMSQFRSPTRSTSTKG